jgi:hypothetical protein
MKMRSWFLLACATPLFLAAQLTTSEAYRPAPCSPGYKRVKHQPSGNWICVLDVVGSTRLKLKTK